MGEEATDNNGDKVSVLAVWDGEMRGHFKGRRLKSLILRREEPVEKSTPEPGFLIE